MPSSVWSEQDLIAIPCWRKKPAFDDDVVQQCVDANVFIVPVNDADEYGVFAGKQFAQGDVVFPFVSLYSVDHATILQGLGLTAASKHIRSGKTKVPEPLHLFHHIALEALPCVEDFCSDDNLDVAWADVSHHACWFVNSILPDDPPDVHSNVAFDDYVRGKEGAALRLIAIRDIGVGEQLVEVYLGNHDQSTVHEEQFKKARRITTHKPRKH